MDPLATLASGVAHDLNNVLMPLVAYPDLLMTEFEAGSQPYQDIMEIKRSALKAADVVRDLMTLSRRTKYEMIPVNINDVVKNTEAAPSYGELREQHPSASLEYDLVDSPWMVPGALSHLSRALNYLVINAFGNMRQGGTVTVRTENKTLDRPVEGYEPIPSGAYAVLSVHDTGPPIKDEDLTRIFEPYYWKTIGRDGLGLGMAVVYGVVKDHGGYVDVESDEGKGTTIRLYLPKGVARKKSAIPAEPESNLQGTESILVVDDLPDQRDVSKRLLTRLGYRVTTAASGREAVALVRESVGGDAACPFDLVVLDMVMEGDFDGLDAYRELQKLVPGLKCVIVSGYSETDRLKRALDEGVGAFVRKPYNTQLLVEAIRKELDGAYS